MWLQLVLGLTRTSYILYIQVLILSRIEILASTISAESSLWSIGDISWQCDAPERINEVNGCEFYQIKDNSPIKGELGSCAL